MDNNCHFPDLVQAFSYVENTHILPILKFFDFQIHITSNAHVKFLTEFKVIFYPNTFLVCIV